MAAPLIDQAIGHIQDLIARGVLAPGSRLPPEQQLSVMLGCSRSTTREAVRALVMARVLDVRRGDGTYVTSLEPGLLLEGLRFVTDVMQDESLLELFDIRMLLEPVATARAAEKISDDRLAELAAILEQMRLCTGDDEDSVLVQHDARFHALVAESAGNQTLASLLDGMSSRTMHARLWHGIREADASAGTVSQHAEILEALRARDPKMAYAAATLHIAKTQAWFRQMVQAGDWRRLPGPDTDGAEAASA